MKKVLKKIKKIFMKKQVAVILVILACIAVAICIYFVFFNKTDKEIIYEDYKILENHEGKIEEYDKSYTVDGYKGDNSKGYYITGKIIANKDKGFTVITFDLYDKNNKLLGTAVGGLNEMKSGKTYNFKALSLIDSKDINKIAYYKIKQIKEGK